MIYNVLKNVKVMNEESYMDRIAPFIGRDGKRYGRNPRPEDFPDIDRNLYDKENTEVELVQIPRQYARENIHFNPDEVDINSIDCYNFYLFKQGNGVKDINTHNIYVLLKLPSGKFVNIIIYKNGGAEFDPSQRKYVLREYDALDRRIILGFCIEYQTDFLVISNRNFNTISPVNIDELRSNARHFQERKINKRLKVGEYDNNGIFKNIMFV